MPKSDLEVTFSVSPEIFPQLVHLIKEHLNILPSRIDNPAPPFPDKRIFINYRRTDSEDVCGRIYDRLVQRFGKASVFRDVVNLPAGLDFRPILEREVAACHIMLVLMGRQWSTGANKKRLHQANDYVRFEIETALQRDIPVIPVWVGRRTSMPNPEQLPASLHGLLHRQARNVRPDPDFHTDMDRLIEDVATNFEIQSELKTD